MSNSRKVASNTLVQLFGRIISTGVSILIVALLTRKLGVAGYGEYSIVFAYLGLYAVLADFGYFYLLVRKLSAKEGDPTEIASNLITMRTFTAILIYALSFGIIQFFPYSHEIKQAALIATIAFLAGSIQNTIFGIFQVYYQMYWAVITDNISRLLTLGFLYYFVLTNFNLNNIIWAYVIGNVTGTILLIILARRLVKFTLAFNFSLWKGIFKESLYFAIAIVTSYLYFKVDSIMLSVMKTATDVGIYAPGVKIIDVLLVIPQMFIGTVLPICSLYFANKDVRLKETVQKTFDILALFMAGIVGGVFALSPQIINFIAGKDYIHISTVSVAGHPITPPIILSILIFTAVFSFLGPTFVMLLVASGKQKILVWPNIIALILNVVLNFIFIPHYSYLAAAVATIITEVFIFSSLYYLTRKEFGFYISFVRLGKVILAGVIMVIILKLILLPFIISILFGSIIYLVLCYLFGAIRPEIFDLISKSINSLRKGRLND